MSKDRSPSRIVMWLQYLGLRTVASFFYLIGPWLSMRIASAIGKLMYRCVGRLRRRVESNISRSMPEWDARHVSRVGRDSIVHFVKLGIEVLTLHSIVKRDIWATYIDVDQTDPGVAKANELLKSNQPVILLGGTFR